MHITTSANDPAHKIANMFDDMDYTVFAPDEMRTYDLKISKSTISHIKFSPVRRRGYSTDFTIFVKVAGLYYKCTGDNPEIRIKPAETDTISIAIVSNVKGSRAEFVKDTLVSVAINTADPRHIHAIERIDIFNNGELLNDSVQVDADNNQPQSTALPQDFADNYKSNLYGQLADKVISISNNGYHCTWVIRSNGQAAFFTENKHYFEGYVKKNKKML